MDPKRAEMYHRGLRSAPNRRRGSPNGCKGAPDERKGAPDGCKEATNEHRVALKGLRMAESWISGTPNGSEEPRRGSSEPIWDPMSPIAKPLRVQL